MPVIITTKSLRETCVWKVQQLNQNHVRGRFVSPVVALNVLVKSAVCLICTTKTGKWMISIFKLIKAMPNSVETFDTIELNRKKDLSKVVLFSIFLGLWTKCLKISWVLNPVGTRIINLVQHSNILQSACWKWSHTVTNMCCSQVYLKI